MLIEPNDYLKSLTEDAVIACGKYSELYKLKTLLASMDSIFSGKWPEDWKKGSEFKYVLDKRLKSVNLQMDSDCVENGIRCEVLDTTLNSWTKGVFRLKLVLEFIPDENERESLFAKERREMKQDIEG